MFDIERPLVLAATSDLHGYLEGIQEVCETRKVDILVIAGDIEPADPFVSKPYWFERKFFPLVRKLGCEVVAIPGNHDFWLSAKYISISRNEKNDYPKNFHLLIDEEINIRGIQFYGTPWVPIINGTWCFEEEDDDLIDRFNMIPEGLDVLISHSPPMLRHKVIDVSLDNPTECQRHFGSKSLTKAIAAKQPKVVLCGHIHSGEHSCNSIATGLQMQYTLAWNVSRVNEQYRIAYKIKLLELNKDAVREIN